MARGQSAKERVRKNVEVCRRLLEQVTQAVDMIALDEDPDFGDVGDIAHIREGLNHLMGYEDRDPD